MTRARRKTAIEKGGGTDSGDRLLLFLSASSAILVFLCRVAAGEARSLPKPGTRPDPEFSCLELFPWEAF